MLWHRNREFVLEKLTDGQFAMPVVLPKVPARSEMMRAYRAFVKGLQSKELPEHRRIRVKLKVTASAGNAGLQVEPGDDAEYAVRKLIQAVHETYLVFLYDGARYDYLVETFDLDPDHLA
ncbi:hypothetical protein F183_A15940 [Bryobacterales bacterium F-183]|nr:hypothetical protein F183_A15940 [Bryobacterales bacterium F-183]